MSYKNAENVLPKELLEEIQQYVHGECLYIPQRENAKRSWGDLTATRRILEDRNRSIVQEYQKGVPTTELADKYFLSVKSIQRIIKEWRE